MSQTKSNNPDNGQRLVQRLRPDIQFDYDTPSSEIACVTSPRLGTGSPYEPLDGSQPQFRLLRIHPRTDPSSNLIDGHLRIFNQEEAPPYRALSYMWGPETPIVEIRINGHLIKVRKNLFDFLLVFRLESSNDYIWIDQICIQQASTSERNHQVQMMAEIYRGASLVMIWLGPVGGFDYARGISRVHTDEELKWEDVHRYPLLYRFSTSRYWERLWVIQEVLLARDIKVYFGQTIVDWHVLAKHSSSVRFAPWLSEFTAQKTVLWESLPVLDALEKCIATECQDPRDKYYGLHGLLKADHRLIVDYSKSVRDVFIDAAVMVVQASPQATHTHVSMILVRLALTMGMHSHSPLVFKFESCVRKYMSEDRFEDLRELYKQIARSEAECLKELRCGIADAIM